MLVAEQFLVMALPRRQGGPKESAQSGALFRGKLLAFLKRAVDQGDLEVDSVTSFNTLLGTLYSKKWNVDCREPFTGPRHVVEYLGRYTHRVAISNHRIIAIHDGKVSFKYRDPSKTRIATFPGIEFVRRFLQHVLPKGFIKIRHYGILANRNRKPLVSQTRLLLVSPEPVPQEPQSWYELLETLTGTNPFKCPFCDEGTLVLKAELQPQRAPPTTALAHSA